jgi:hypothetical protein
MTKTRRFNPDRDVVEWKGGSRPYDLLKEVTICFIVVAILTIALAILFSSPSDRAVSLHTWATSSPVDFAQTAITELDGTSASATYGPPYNNTAGVSQRLGPISLAELMGVNETVNPPTDFVLQPLKTVRGDHVLYTALATFSAAGVGQQASWERAYEKSVVNATASGGSVMVPSGDYGPVSQMISSLTQMAQSGALDTSMLNEASFFGMDYTKSLLFLSDGGYLTTKATGQHLTGDQWGMMNEVGNYPGQSWLWLYTMWYQVKPFSTSANADVQVWALMMLLSALLIMVPFIPVLRSIPRWSKVYRIIWRDHYRSET